MGLQDKPWPAFMFATGIENFVPDHRRRQDARRRNGHVRPLRHGGATTSTGCEELGLFFLRYGPPITRTWLGDGRYDWSFADETFGDLLRRDIVPITDLCHFGVPDWVGNFQNPDFPELFAGYAGDFAQPLPVGAALHAGQRDVHLRARSPRPTAGGTSSWRRDRAFVTALKHIVRANVLAMHAILDVRAGRDLRAERVVGVLPPRQPGGDRTRPKSINARRFLSLDLNYGRRDRLGDVRVPDGQRHDARRVPLLPASTSSSTTASWATITTSPTSTGCGRTVSTEAAGEVFGYDGITWQYYDRYHLPVMHTETNLAAGPEWRRGGATGCGNSGQTCCAPAQRRRADRRLHLVLAHRPGRLGHRAARDRTGACTRVGLYDLDRKIRPVGEAYKKLIADWREVLPDAERLPARADRAARTSTKSPGPRSGGQRRKRTATMPATEPAQRPAGAEESAMARFQDRVAIVTGATSGIGLATAQRLGSEGARSWSRTWTERRRDAAVDQIRDAGAPDVLGRRLRRGRRSAGRCDRARERSSGSARLDVVVNNAGRDGVQAARGT